MRKQVTIDPVEQHVIDFVRNLRISKNITQEDIASIMLVSRSFIKDVESINTRSKYNLKHINALADYFNMSPRDFLPLKPIAVNPAPKEKQSAKKSVPPKKALPKKALTKKK